MNDSSAVGRVGEVPQIEYVFHVDFVADDAGDRLAVLLDDRGDAASDDSVSEYRYVFHFSGLPFSFSRGALLFLCALPP